MTFLDVIIRATILLLFAVVLWPKVNSGTYPVTTDLFKEDLGFQKTFPSTVSLLAKLKSRSAIECVILCSHRNKCKINTFEKSSGDCFLYKARTVISHRTCKTLQQSNQKPTQGPNQGVGKGNASQRLRGITRYYSHVDYRPTEGSSDDQTSWILLFFESRCGYYHVFNLTDNKWQSYKFQKKQMASIQVESGTWRLFWTDSQSRTLVSSDLKGNHQKVIATKLFVIWTALDPIARRLYYVELYREEVGFVDIDTGEVTVVVKKIPRAAMFIQVEVFPSLRFLYYTDNYSLFHKTYDMNDTTRIPGYTHGCYGFTIDHEYSKLLWFFKDIKSMVWSGLMGENMEQIELPEWSLRQSLTYLWDGRIYIADRTYSVIRIFDCDGNQLHKIQPRICKQDTDDRSLVFVPEHVYRNI